MSVAARYGTWDIENILKAEKVGREWHLTIKWRGWSTPTIETRAWLRNPDNCTDKNLIADAERLIDAARRRQRGIAVADEDDEESESEDEESPIEVADGSDQVMFVGSEQDMLANDLTDDLIYFSYLRSKLLIISSFSYYLKQTNLCAA